MKVMLLKTGETATFNDEYAERLIEQGKAVVAGDEKPGAKAETEKAEPAKAEEPANTGKKK